MRRSIGIPFFFLSCALAVLSLAPVSATPQGDGWATLETENFSVTSQLDEASTRQIGTDLERLRVAIGTIFDRVELDSPVPTFLFVFANQGGFAPYSLGGGGEPGYFAPHIHANFAAVVGADAADALPIVYRQYIHELINFNNPAMPAWFRHGLAELFSTFQADAQEAHVALRGADDLGVAGGAPLPLAELLSDYRSPTAAPDARAIQRSWELVHYLLAGDSKRFQTTVAWVRGLREDSAAAGSLVDALGTDLPSLEGALNAYVGQGEMPSHRIPLQGVSTTADFQQATPSFALFRLGDLLIHTADDPGRRAAAEQHFERSLELQPGFAPALAGLGLVRQAEGDLPAAETYFEQALEQVDDAFRLQFVYGDCELDLLGRRRPTNDEEGERLDKAIRSFARTTELNPNFGEGWARLGYSYNLQTKPSPEALPALERGYEMLPGRADVAYNLMLGYARSGERDKAWSLLDAMEARGADADTLSRSRQVALQIDLQSAGPLARQKRYDDAIGLLGRVVAESSVPQIQQQAADAVKSLAAAASPNRFGERYAEAYTAFMAGDRAAAIETLDSLAADASDGLQSDIVADLRHRVGDS